MGDINHKHECVELYKEWTGQDAKFEGVAVDTHLVVAIDTDTGKKVGAAQWTVINDQFWNCQWALVENVYVAKVYRQRGVARDLMKFIEDVSPQFGCEFIKLTSGYDKIEAHALYRSLGYKEGFSFKKDLK